VHAVARERYLIPESLNYVDALAAGEVQARVRPVWLALDRYEPGSVLSVSCDVHVDCCGTNVKSAVVM